jgi:glycerol-3-phosphate acyltransferase PlsY
MVDSVRSATSVGLVAGPLVLVGYLLGSLSRWRDPRRGRDILPPSPGVQALVDAGLALAAATLAWKVTHAVAPPSSRSAVGFNSDQVLMPWESIALWAGLAAVLGHAAPVWSRFRGGGSGLVPALALAAAYSPTVLSLALGSMLVATLGTGTPRRGLPVALGATVSLSWLAWVRDTPPGWGMPNGPELSLWVAVLCGVLFARWLRGDVLAVAGATGAGEGEGEREGEGPDGPGAQ